MKVVLASGNVHKCEEIAAVLPRDIELVTQTSLGIGSVPETGLTFVENAIIKARHASSESGLAALADDSGIEVDYLRGAPGIYSARYSGDDATDAANNEKLLRELEGVPAPQRTARFQCVIVFLRHALDPTPIIASGTWAGTVLTAPRGESGFGYDPLFYVPALGQTVAELAPEEKTHRSHRGQALARLCEALGTQ